jgi:hypothetical protein
VVFGNEYPIAAGGTTTAPALLQDPELHQATGDLRDLRDMVAGHLTEFFAGGPAIPLTVSKGLQGAEEDKLRFAEIPSPR